MTGCPALKVRGTAGAELFQSLRRPRRSIDDLRIAFTPRLGADDVTGCEEGHARELHESSLAPSVRRRSEEMPALPAARPARPPAIKPAFRPLPSGNPALSALPEPTPGRRALIPLAGLRNPADGLDTTSSVSVMVWRSRCVGLFCGGVSSSWVSVQRLVFDALVIAFTSSPLVMVVRCWIPMLAASSTSSGLL